MLLNCIKLLGRFALSRNRMASSSSATFFPPEAVKGMTEFDPTKFEKVVEIPVLRVPSTQIGRILGLKPLQDAFLKSGTSFKRVQTSSHKSEKLCLLDPEKCHDAEKLDEIKMAVNRVLDSEVQVDFVEFTLKYEDWDIKRCIRAILPDGLEFSSHTQTGHILHLNLREELRPYRFVLAKVLLDKIPTIVNKSDHINTEFRFFELELLAGEPNYECTVQEHGFKYKLDFSSVFWNSRLMTEHNRIVQEIRKSSTKVVLLDVFAGVGPFAIPSAFSKNTIKVYANDLNPTSVKYLNENVKLNKVRSGRIEVFNMDGAEFIRDVLPKAVVEHVGRDRGNGETESVHFHAIMNLPALAVTFLPSFTGVLGPLKDELCGFEVHVHVHCFPKAEADEQPDWYKNRAISMVHEQLPAEQIQVQSVHFVRNVAGRKDMYCVSFKINNNLLFDAGDRKEIAVSNGDQQTKQSDRKCADQVEEVEIKRTKLSVD